MKIKKIEFEVSGMTCDHCARTIEKLFDGKDGVHDKRVSYREAKAVLAYDADKVSERELANIINASDHYRVKESAAFEIKQYSSKSMVIIGGGSAAFAAAIKASEIGASVTMINDGLIGGTCVNIGCVPSKAMIKAAAALHVDGRFNGIERTARVTDYGAVVNHTQSLVDELRQKKYIDVLKSYPNVKFIEGRAELESENSLRVNGESLSFERLLIATGASPYIADIPGLREADPLDSTAALAMKKLPKSIIVIGGRYIAVELAQMFSRMGARVTVLQRSERLIPTEDPDIAIALKKYLKEDGLEIHTGVKIKSVQRTKSAVRVEANVNGKEMSFESEEIIAATGRRANTSDMGLEKVGVTLNADATVKVNSRLESDVPNIYAAGDVIGEPAYVYTAAYEGALAAENALTDADKERDYDALPWVIFSDPQVAGVGMGEKQAEETGIETDVAVLDMSYVPNALVSRDTRGFVKLIRKKGSDTLIGARVIAADGGELITECALAIKYKIPVTELAQTFHPYLTRSEAIKLCAQTFDKDVSKLSCCS